MLEFSKIATLEKNKLSTDAPFLILIEVNCELLDEPLYLARNTEDVVWNDHTWTAYPIDVEPHEEDGKTIPVLFADTADGMSVDNVVFDKSPVQMNGYEIAVAIVLFETGDGFVHKFGFEDDDANLVMDPFTHLAGFGSEGDTNGISDGYEVLC